MIEQMNPCTKLKEDETVCGGQDFSFNHRVEGAENTEQMIVSRYCNGCQDILEHPVNVFDVVSEHIGTCECICGQKTLAVAGTTGTIKGDKYKEPVMTVPTKCNGCQNERDYHIKIRDVANPKIIETHNTDNPIT